MPETSRIKRYWLVTGIMTCLWTSPAWPDDAAVAETARKWNLLGVWKGDCHAGPSREDVAFRYVVRSGLLYQERDAGTGARDSNLVSFAQAGTDGRTFDLTIMFASGPRTLILKREGAGKVWVWSSRTTGTDEYNIKDGRFVDGNVGRPLLTQCSRYGDK